MANTKSITDKAERKKAEAHRAQEGCPESASHLCPRLGKAQGEEAGTRSVEALVRPLRSTDEGSIPFTRDGAYFCCGSDGIPATRLNPQRSSAVDPHAQFHHARLMMLVLRNPVAIAIEALEAPLYPTAAVIQINRSSHQCYVSSARDKAIYA